MSRIKKVTWMQDYGEFWIETDQALSKSGKLYKLKDRSCIHRNPDIMAHFNDWDQMYDLAAEFLIDS